MAFLVRGVDQWSAARPEVARLRSNTMHTTWNRRKRSKVRVYALHSSDANLLGSARQVLCLFWIVGANRMFLIHSQCVLRRCRVCQCQLVGPLTHRLAKVSQSASHYYSTICGLRMIHSMCILCALYTLNCMGRNWRLLPAALGAWFHCCCAGGESRDSHNERNSTNGLGSSLHSCTNQLTTKAYKSNYVCKRLMWDRTTDLPKTWYVHVFADFLILQ